MAQEHLLAHELLEVDLVDHVKEKPESISIPNVVPILVSIDQKDTPAKSKS